MVRFVWLGVLVIGCSVVMPLGAAEPWAKLPSHGICAVLGLDDASLPQKILETTKLTIVVQTASEAKARQLETTLERDGYLGQRAYVILGKTDELELASNLVDAAVINVARRTSEIRNDALRVLHPKAHLWNARGQILETKPTPAGQDDWSHPYHGPDNNPQSRDQTIKGPFLTKFLAEPWYVPMPQVTVVSGGRIFKAFGHIALKKREWPWLNKLVAMNAYNGTILWHRPLLEGFMIHRNAMIATPEHLYLADANSCKILSAMNGEQTGEIKIDRQIDPDGVWKWMALKDGTLYAIVGKKEVQDKTIRGEREKAGWPWSQLGPAYGGQYPWGFGRTVVALNPTTGKVLWHYRAKGPMDTRAVCLTGNRILIYSHQKFLAALDIKTGNPIWFSEDKAALDAIGEHDRAQTASKGFASTVYAKANQHGWYFAGPQRKQLVAISIEDGSLMWNYNHGNFQLVLRDEGLFAMGRTETSKIFDYKSGKVVSDLMCYRGNCTRATGTAESIFTRGYRHTGTMRLDIGKNRANRMGMMRPACQDGVIAAHGHLYWGPWMCDCNHSLVGVIALDSAGDFDFESNATEQERLQTLKTWKPTADGDALTWPSYRGDATRSGHSSYDAPVRVDRHWSFATPGKAMPTAPVVGYGLAFFADVAGVVRAVDVETGKLAWMRNVGGAVRFPPELAHGSVYVGSGNGRVYCLDARTGEPRWVFRAAPASRRIAVHGRILSNWPVGSGVLVHGRRVYAAAGITSYDGTHVYALDALTGKILWQNNRSGHLVHEDRVTGVSVQGHLLLDRDKLYLAGGNIVSPAQYDVGTGECLNQLSDEWWRRPENNRERFPSKPQSSMFFRSPRGRELFVVDGKVRVFDQLLYSPPKYGPSRYFGGHFLQTSNDVMGTVRGTTGKVVRLSKKKTDKGQPIGLWQYDGLANPLAMLQAKNAVIVAGELKKPTSTGQTFALQALDLTTGKPAWSQPLDAPPVSWGLGIDKESVFITLENGTLIRFKAAK